MDVRRKRVKHLVLWRELSYLLKGIMPTTQCSHGWGTSPLFKIDPYRGMEKHWTLLRESLMLEARGPSNLFNIVNWVSCGKEYCLPLSVFVGENITFLQYHPIQVNRRSTVALVRESLMLEGRESSTILSIDNWVHFERNMAYLSAFSWVTNISFVQNSPSQVKAETL
jgi:hypothetical protein